VVDEARPAVKLHPLLEELLMPGPPAPLLAPPLPAPFDPLELPEAPIPCVPLEPPDPVLPLEPAPSPDDPPPLDALAPPLLLVGGFPALPSAPSTIARSAQ
jgi:homeobox protein ESX1